MSGLLFSWSLLVLFPAPTNWLWIGAILVGEWGHFGALFGLLLTVLLLRRGGRVGVIAAMVAITAAIICAIPTRRAMIIAGTLPQRCTVGFGDHGPPSRVPFSPIDLFRGVRIGPVEVTEHVYAFDGAKQLKLDLYRRKERTGAQPLIVIIHGGSWNGGSKQQLPAVNRWLAGEGYVIASINYRHAPKWAFPAAIEDVFHALDFLKAHASELGIDPTRVALIGRSAGGQIALSAAYANRDAAIRGVVALYAPTDLVLGYEKPSAPGVIDSRRVLEDYLGGSPTEQRDIYMAASPLNFINSTTPPTLLIHGDLDPIVSPVHSRLLATRLQKAARPSLYLALPWATHGCDANLSGPSGQLSLYAIDRFLAAVFTDR